MAPRIFSVPLSSKPERFSMKLGERSYLCVSRWNGQLPAWVLDFYDGETEARILMSLPIVTGVNLLCQVVHLGFGGSLVAVTDGDLDAAPTFTNLGKEGNLYFVVAS